MDFDNIVCVVSDKNGILAFVLEINSKEWKNVLSDNIPFSSLENYAPKHFKFIKTNSQERVLLDSRRIMSILAPRTNVDNLTSINLVTSDDTKEEIEINAVSFKKEDIHFLNVLKSLGVT